MTATARFVTLKYRVDLTYDVPLDQAFPELFRIPEIAKLRGLENWEKIFRYIVILYSKTTPLIREYPSDLRARKEAALLAAGFERIEGEKWPIDVLQMIDLYVEAVFKAILAFLRHQNNPLWTEICVTAEELFSFQQARAKPMLEGDDPKGRNALMEGCATRIKYLDSLFAQFFGDSQADIMNSEYAEMIRPETAERILAAEQPVSVPV